MRLLFYMKGNGMKREEWMFAFLLDKKHESSYSSVRSRTREKLRFFKYVRGGTMNERSSSSTRNGVKANRKTIW